MRAFSQVGSLVLLACLTGIPGLTALASLPAIAQTSPSPQKAEADRLQQQGFQQLEARQFDAALQSWQQALQLYRQLGDRSGEFLILYSLGLLYYSQMDTATATRYFEEGLALAKQLQDLGQQWNMLSALGSMHSSIGENKQAIAYYQPALEVAQQLKDLPKQQEALTKLSKLYQEIGDPAKAAEYQKQQAAIAAQLPATASTSDPIFTELSAAQALLSEGSKTSLQQAIPMLKEAREQAKAAGQVQYEALALIALGSAYSDLGDKQQAINHYRQALPLLQALGDRYTQAVALLGIGSASDDLGQSSEALKTYQEALTLLRELKNRPGEATALNNMGNIHMRMGNYQQALQNFQQVLKIAESVGDRTRLNRTFNNIGLVYTEMGQYQQAFTAFEKALKNLDAKSDRFNRATTLSNLGTVYRFVGQMEPALQRFQEAQKVLQEAGDPSREGYALANIGSIYHDQEKYDEALAVYQRSLKLLEQANDIEGQSTALNNMGLIYDDLGQSDKALTYYNQALPLSEAIPDPTGTATTKVNMGRVYYGQQNFAQAIQYQQQAVAIAKEIGNQRILGYALSNLGKTQLAAGQLKAAENSLLSGIQVWESLRENLGDDDSNKISIFDEQANTYRSLQRTLIAAKQPERALEIAERGRARAFVELLNQRLPNQTTTAPVAIQTATVQPPNLAQIRQIAKEHNTTLVEYSIVYDDRKSITPDPAAKPQLYIWVVQPTGSVTFRQVPLDQPWLANSTRKKDQPLQALVAQSRSAIGARGIVFKEDNAAIARAVENQTSEDQRLQQLYQLLIQPIADVLPKDPNARVTFIPQQSLFLVPFAALPDAKGQVLIEKHTILVAPSIQVLDLTYQQRQRLQKQTLGSQAKPALIVGNPTMPKISLGLGEPPEQLSSLPGAEQEAQAIAELLKTKALTGDQATEPTVIQQMTQARMIHLATHGLLEDVQGLGVPGAIALAPTAKADGLLTSQEILDLRLQAELVVLSACDTGQGRITGDGVIGLSRSLISAGVPSVVVSLWKVPDEPTAALMTEFYQQLQRSPDKAQALRQAMLKTKASYPDPLDWAAFMLIGEAE